MKSTTFVSGGTGYIGSALIPALLARGIGVRALVRPQSQHRLEAGAYPVVGDALAAESFREAIAPADTFVHLVGTPHPNPAKAREFREVDLRSIRAAVAAAKYANVRHMVYLSVAQPAPVMAAYIAVRKEGEELVRGSGMHATIARPWYVLGPGHYWPLAVLPAYWVMERFTATRDIATRLGLVTIEQLTAALVRAVQDPPAGVRVLDVPAIRAAKALQAVST